MKLSTTQQNAIKNFKQFVFFRNKISLILSIGILLAYYIFILAVGIFPEILGYHLGPSSITLGIIAGIFLIVLCIFATGLYTFLANNYFDKEQKALLENLSKQGVLDSLKNGELDYKQCEDSKKT